MTRLSDEVLPIEPVTRSLLLDSFPAKTTPEAPDEVFVIPPDAVARLPPDEPRFAHVSESAT